MHVGPTDPDVSTHRISSDLDCYCRFYESLSDSVSFVLRSGTLATFNFDSYILSSMRGTLDSMKLVLLRYRIGDAYSLLRRAFDLAVTHIYAALFLEENVGLDNLVVKEIDSWIQGTRKIPTYREMSQYIRNSGRFKAVNELLYEDDRYKNARARCNDHAHFNYYAHVLANDSEIYAKARRSWLDQLALDLQDVIVLHLAYLFTLSGHYMSSSDYVDALECGLTPEINSQYWVAPFVQEMFNDVLQKARPDVVAAIKRETFMFLE